MSRLFSAPALRRVVPALLLGALLLLVAAGCGEDTPQNTFAPEGPVADRQRDIFLLAMWPAVVILVLVELAILVIVVRFRRRPGNELPKQTHGNTRLEVAWTIAPALLLTVLSVPMMGILFDLADKPEDAFEINVTGQQWVWTFEYPSITDENGEPLSTAAEFHFPAGRDIVFHVRSNDVVHSFAIPRLAGTVDAVPGEVNTFWVRADRPGTYAGQCREFCGIGHADMRLVAHADTEEDFEAWVAEELGGGEQTGTPTPRPAGAATPSPRPAATATPTPAASR